MFDGNGQCPGVFFTRKSGFVIDYLDLYNSYHLSRKRYWDF